MNARGFSMTELLVVLAVTGILAVLGYPYVATYLQSASLKAGAQELAAILNGGRQLAISRNTNVCVSLSSNSAVYTTGVSATCAGGTTYVSTNTRADGSMALDNNMQISATTANVVFSSMGAAVQAGTYTVRNPTTNATLSVVVSTAGRVTIQ